MALLASAGNLDRLRQITQVLARHGFGELLARTELAGLLPFRKSDEAAPKIALGERLRLAIQELGPSFVKLGQILSTRPDLLPPDVIAELKKLQEDVPPVPFEDVRRTIEETVGCELSALFESFDEKPLASASIGQVHRARLRIAPSVGEPSFVDVAVKVQRPDIRETIERDVDLLYLLARIVERAFPESSIYSPTRLVAEFDKAIMAELDYTIEGGNAGLFAANFAATEMASLVRFPRFVPEVSGKKVHVAEYFDGCRINEALEHGFPGDQIARNAVHVIAQMIFVDGLFHADPHPGNIRILGTPEAPVIGMLDLGMVGTLSPEMRDKTVDLMVAAISRDVDELADALVAMGKPREKIDRDAFRAEVARLAQLHLGKPLREIQLSALIRDLVQGAIDFQIEMPTEMMMVGKTLMTVECIGKILSPDLDVFEQARPFLLKLVYQRYSPQKMGVRMLKVANKVSGAALDLPPLIAEVLDDARRGRLRVRAEDPGLGTAAERLGRRIALGLMGTAWIGAGTAMYLGGHLRVGELFFAVALVFTLIAWGTIPMPRKKG